MLRDSLSRNALLAAAGALVLASAACRSDVEPAPVEGPPALEVQPAAVDTTLPPHQTADPALDPVMPLPQAEPASPGQRPSAPANPSAPVPRPLPPAEPAPPAEDPVMPLPQAEPPYPSQQRPPRP